jgi:RimJ/RimL family protein N-acetyltransferase
MYVTPAHRGRGIGSRLLEAVLDRARSLPGVSQVHLCVGSTSVEARHLYERSGFRAWGTDVEALRHRGEAADTIYMTLAPLSKSRQRPSR